MPADLSLTHYSDPACPFGFSAEPYRLGIVWTYGDQVEIDDVMIGLAETAQDQADKGLTTEMLAGGNAKLAREHGMPIDSSERSRLAGTVPACRAVVAARVNAPDVEEALLRALRVRHFRGEFLDEPETIAGAASDVGIAAGELESWLEQDEVEAALREDMDRARHPSEAALVLDGKLAGWEGGRRYTCPSYEVESVATDDRVSIPGFQPWAVYEVALANIAPGLERRAPAESAREVLEWAPYPLASAEVAQIMGVSIREAREGLATVGKEDAVGGDGYWSLSAGGEAA